MKTITVEIRLIDDESGEPIYETRGPAITPIAFRTVYEKPLEHGVHHLWAFQYAPVVSVAEKNREETCGLVRQGPPIAPQIQKPAF